MELIQADTVLWFYIRYHVLANRGANKSILELIWSLSMSLCKCKVLSSPVQGRINHEFQLVKVSFSMSEVIQNTSIDKVRVSFDFLTLQRNLFVSLQRLWKFYRWRCKQPHNKISLPNKARKLNSKIMTFIYQYFSC